MKKLTLKKRIVILVVPIVFVSVILLGLFLIQPQIKSKSIKPDKANISLEPIKLESNYPVFKFDSKHKISFSDGKTVSAKDYTSKADDYSEGENTIKIYKIRNYGIFSVISSKPDEYKIQVDRVAPTLSIDGNYSKYSLLEDNLKVSVQRDPDAKILLADQEIIVTDNAVQLPLTNGQNTFKLVAQDAFGNKSNEGTVQSEAFKPAGWQKIHCENLSFPLNRTKLQENYGNDGTKLYTDKEVAAIEAQCKVKNASYTYSITIQPIGTKFPCNGPCDAFVPYIYVETSKLGTKAVISNMTKTVKNTDPFGPGGYSNGKSESYTSKRGLKGSMVTQNFNVMTQSGDYVQKAFVFEDQGITYKISMIYEKKKSTSYKNTLTSHFNQIIDNMIIE